MEYTHGGDVYRNTIEYDFSVNLNPLGMPEACRDISEACVGWGCYPDYKADKVVKLLAQDKGLTADSVMLTNGAAEMIYLIAAYAGVRFGKGFRAFTTAPTFTEYEAAVKAYGGVMDYFYLRESELFDVDGNFVEAINDSYKVVFMCNPNNPTGRVVNRDLMKAIADNCAARGILLVIDESFIQFISDEEDITMVNELENYNNIIIIQAFTKIYGMPGIRLGYGMSSNNELLRHLRCLVQPWNTSVPAQKAGYLALQDKDFVVRTRKYVDCERTFLYNELNGSLARMTVPGKANFILFKADRALYDRLMRHGVMIRKCGDFPGLSDEYFRIGVKNRQANQALIDIWRKEYGYS